jgi:predicted enzyme related to lactoylglutathione lyase
MPDIRKHPQGTFCWAELRTPDPVAARKFYGPLLNWEFQEFDIGGGEKYHMGFLREKSAGAMAKLGEHLKKMGVPPHWGIYMAVDSADVMTKKVATVGGKVLEGPFDVMDVGRMSLVQDPAGAVFMLWEAKKHIGVEVKNEPGAIAWPEVYTNDVERCGSFYSGLFGWKPEPMGKEYFVMMLAGKGEAGMCLMSGEMKAHNVPSHWMHHFQVASCEKSAEQVRKLGGTVMFEGSDPNVGSFAICRDPQGAHFGLFEPKT